MYNILQDYVWIGGYDFYDNDTYYWLDGARLDAGYTNYDEDGMDGDNEDALMMYYYDWTWFTDIITTEKAALCERDL